MPRLVGETLAAALALTLLCACAATPSMRTESPADAPAAQPNFLVIVLDDVGFADLGAFGSEVATPNLDRLAANGTLLSNFYTAPTCSPTRAMLLTGVDSHRAGLGNMDEFMADNQRGRDGYEGYLNDRVVTVAEILRAGGYQTYMTGKWHLGLDVARSPWARGFDRSFASLMGGASHFDDMAGPTVEQQRAAYRADRDLVSSLPENFYTSDFFTDEMIRYIDAGRDSGNPFLAYLAFTAVHFPVQAPDAYLEKYRGRYDAGYEHLREARFQRLKSLGLVRRDAELPVLHPSVAAWDSLSTAQQEGQARAMEAYAAMLDNLDANIGRLVDYLENTGQYDNTYLVVISDNGPEGNPLTGPMFKGYVDAFDNSLENIGRKGSFVAVGPGWAEASSAPFRGFKSYTSEGGIRVPAFVRAPGNANAGSVITTVASVRDITPTLLEAAAVAHPGNRFEGREVETPSGRSLLGLLRAGEAGARGDSELFATELFGRRALRMGRWKAVLQEMPNGTGAWELYDLRTDPGERNNLAQAQPEVLREAIARFEEYARDNRLIYPQGPAGY
ncbi:MAG: arylsulfatase [Halioglobus sp.]|nr:arylsulfatase [Halioglobus sp.]|tara:strand:- start:852 stop:2531 length:1680 start_codon:yes stop_codon:yes gene_type:complete